jgi:3-mercaptopyruvate sulfurtransferase SseA
MTPSDVLVGANWVQAHLDDPGVVPVEVDEDASAYDRGHIRGAVRLNWNQDLQDPVTRGFIGRASFESLLSERGIANDDMVILYSGTNNWFATYAYWYFKVYGHRRARVLDGGREQWELDARELVTGVPHRPATVYRAQRPERWVRMVIRARKQGALSPRQRRWPWRGARRQAAAPGPGGAGQPRPVGHGNLPGPTGPVHDTLPSLGPSAKSGGVAP